jgi:hypothetical protein
MVNVSSSTKHQSITITQVVHRPRISTINSEKFNSSNTKYHSLTSGLMTMLFGFRLYSA